MTLILFAALAGAIQMIAPDRWMPASVLAWQRGWKMSRIGGFSVLIFTAHVALGFGLYECLAKFLERVSEGSLGVFTLIFLGLVGTIRAVHFSRLREVLYRQSRPVMVIFTLLSLLGPSEMVIPILMKARLDGFSPLAVLVSFWLGACGFGFVALMFARARWNRPMALPRAVQWGRSRIAMAPMAASVLVGVVLYYGSR